HPLPLPRFPGYTPGMSEKLHVARSSALAGGTLAVLKLSIGFLSGSLALISEGFHSTLDFGVTLVTWFSVKTADVPADREHHYGHGKIENLTAFAQAILLIVTGFFILKEAYSRLVAPPDASHPLFDKGWYAAIAVVVISLIVDVSRSRALAKAAKKFQSQALEADAIHFGTELLSSAAVLAGLLTVRIGGPRLAFADPLAAMFVAGIMIFTALRLGRRAADVLIDRAPEGIETQMRLLIRTVPGVQEVTRVRARQSGANTFVDATITVDPAIGLSAGHQISDNVEHRVTEKFPNVDILVHVEPGQEAPDHAAVIRQLADAAKIRIHAIRIRDIHGGLYINFHAEFPPQTTLAEAHRQISLLEDAIQQRIAGIAEIESHLEPAPT
ncbi:MAG TPA: cation-efflux pump, partial [Phycisphaerae bacterium]|nr:cation-efflux pump [Phycisphaerae bacterium]